MMVRRNAKKEKYAHYLSRSPEETENLGLELARMLPVPGIVLLRGALGTGKTTLTRGIAQGLGVKDPGLINSPSFTLVNIYQGNCPIFHVDLYRLDGARDLYSIGLDDFMGSEGVTIVEWSERLPNELVEATVVEIEDIGEDERILHVLSPQTKSPRRRLRRPKNCE